MEKDRRWQRCLYHPAALDRAADSIRGVETQGLGRSGDGRLPMIEDSLGPLELLSSQTATSNGWLLKGNCRMGSRREERMRFPHLGYSRALSDSGAQVFSSVCPNDRVPNKVSSLSPVSSQSALISVSAR